MSNEKSGPVATPGMPKKNKDLIAFGKNTYDAWNNNAKLPNPNPTLAVFQDDLNAFSDAEAKATTRAKGAAQVRNARRAKVRANIWHWCDYAQCVAETAPSEAEAIAIIQGANFTVTKPGKRSKDELGARLTGVPGEVQLDARAVKGALLYFWEYSEDQVTWHPVPETHVANAVLSGLTPLRLYYFRFRVQTKKGKLDYSQVIHFMVQ